MSSLVSAAEIGLFRANPNANPNNTLRLVDPSTPGTTGTDTLARNVATAPDVTFQGVTYIDKDSTEHTEYFFTMDPVTMEKSYYTLPTTVAEDTLKDAILRIIEQYEVNPIVTVSLSSTTYTIVHKGAGTMDDVIIDGAAVATTRS